MDNNIKNLFTSFSISKKLKELGFDEICLTSYNPNKELVEIFSSAIQGAKLEKYYVKNSLIHNMFVAASTWEQAFKFFRDKYKISGYMIPNNSISGKRGYEFAIDIDYNDFIEGDWYNSYNKARLECIKEIFKIIKEYEL
jgi:hypothetical protein